MCPHIRWRAISTRDTMTSSKIDGTDIQIPAPEPDHEFVVDDGLWEKLRRFASKVPFSSDVLAAYYCTRDPATPPRVKAILIAAIAYFVLPIDAIPDFIPALGFTDDATIIAAVFGLMRSHITPAHQQQASDTLNTLTAHKRPRNEDDKNSD